MSQETLKAALGKTVQGIQENPAMSRVVFEAQTALVEDVRCTGHVRHFAPIVVDEPPELGGQDRGANPVELLLVSLGACQEIMYSAMAAMMGIQLDEVKVSLKGTLDLKGLFGMDPAIPPGSLNSPSNRLSKDGRGSSPADLGRYRSRMKFIRNSAASTSSRTLSA